MRPTASGTVMVKVVEIKKTCDALPAQWEGTDEEGRPVYVRYRWGFLWIGVGKKGEDINSAVDGQEIFGKEIGKSLDGIMSYDGLRAVTAGIIEFPPEEAK